MSEFEFLGELSFVISTVIWKKANKTETEEGLTHTLEEQRALYYHQLVVLINNHKHLPTKVIILSSHGLEGLVTFLFTMGKNLNPPKKAFLCVL